MNINSIVKQIIKMTEHFNKLVFEGAEIILVVCFLA